MWTEECTIFSCHFSSCCSSSTVVLLCFSTSRQLPQCNCRRPGAWRGKEITKQVLNSKVNTPLIVNNRWWGSDWLGYANCPSSQSCLQSRLKTWETTYRMQVHSLKKLYIRESEHQAGKIFPLFFLFANTNCLVRRHVWSLMVYQLCNDSNILQASSHKKI